MDKKIIIFDCNGDSRPAICFNLEMARMATRIVFDEKEAINLLEISRHTGEQYACLLVNNPYLNVDITWLVEQGARLETEVPIVFVKQSEPLQRIVMSLARQYPQLRLHCSEPARAPELIQKLAAEETAGKEHEPAVNKTNIFGWSWRWGR